MNPNDFDNLKFLLTSNDETIAHWLAQADENDIQHAETLLKMYQYEVVDMVVEKDTTLYDANEVISKVKQRRIS